MTNLSFTPVLRIVTMNISLIVKCLCLGFMMSLVTQGFGCDIMHYPSDDQTSPSIPANLPRNVKSPAEFIPDIRFSAHSFSELASYPNKDKITSLIIKSSFEFDVESIAMGVFPALTQLIFEPLQPGLTNQILKTLVPLTPKLKELHVAPSNGLNDTSICLLSKHTPNLTSINVENNPITNAAIKTISGFQNLERLIVANTDITDDCVTYLKVLSNLKFLNIVGTRLSKNAVTELKASTPSLQQPKALRTNKVLS